MKWALFSDVMDTLWALLTIVYILFLSNRLDKAMAERDEAQRLLTECRSVQLKSMPTCRLP